MTTELPVLSCGRIELVEVLPKTSRGTIKHKQRWRMWNDNAELIEDAFRLFVDLKNDRVLDPTYGNGNFYTLARPRKLVAHDLRIDGFDARDMTLPGENGERFSPYRRNGFDAVVLDFPYVSQGGRDTSTISDMQNAYGMYEAPRTPAEVQALIDAGITAAVPLVREGGYIFVKTMNYVTSGAIFDSVRKTKEHAVEKHDLVLVGEFVIGDLPGPQPKTNLDGSPRTQVHGRNNISTLLVFHKPVRRARKAVAPPPPEKKVKTKVKTKVEPF